MTQAHDSKGKTGYRPLVMIDHLYTLPSTTTLHRSYYNLLYAKLSGSIEGLQKVLTDMYIDNYGRRSASQSKKAIKCFCYNIIYAIKYKCKQISFSSDRTIYNSVLINGAKIIPNVGYVGTKNIVLLLEKQNLIKRFLGYKMRDTGESASGYLELTQELVDTVESCVDLDKIKLRQKRSVIVLRDETNNPIEFPMTKYTKHIVSVLTKYNKMMEDYTVELDGSELETGLVRIFNTNFNRGGRLYVTGHSYQGVPSIHRKFITINKQQTGEVDIKASHIAILNTLRGSHELCGEDPYAIPMEGCAEYDLERFPVIFNEYNEEYHPFRNLVKLALLIMVNADSQAKATHALKQKINEQIHIEPEDIYKMEDDDVLKLSLYGLKNINISELFKRLKKRHVAIKDSFFSGAGVELQRIEGDIFTYVVERCVEHDIPVLIIHDSCRTTIQHVRYVAEFIIEAWRIYVGETSNLHLEYDL